MRDSLGRLHSKKRTRSVETHSAGVQALVFKPLLEHFRLPRMNSRMTGIAK